LAALTAPQRAVLAERAGHVREVLTGYQSGTAEVVRAGEPRAEYEPSKPIRARQAAKAAELGVSERTVRRWVQAYSEAGEAGLLDERRLTGRGSTLARAPRRRQGRPSSPWLRRPGAMRPTVRSAGWNRLEQDHQWPGVPPPSVPRAATILISLVGLWDAGVLGRDALSMVFG
jgi:hypothetical protein